jgi:hypothetical protein
MAIVHAPCHRCGADTILAVDQDGIVLCPVDPTPDRTGTLMLAGRYAAWAIPMAVNITAEEIRSRRRRKLDPVGYYHAHACDEEG